MPLVLMAGLQGTGKSTLSRKMAKSLQGVVLDKDILRSVLFPPRFLEYSIGQDDFCYSLMLETAEYLINHDYKTYVFLDGRTFSKTYQVQQAVDLAEKLAVPLKIIECVCSEETVRKRLNNKTSTKRHPAKNRDFELYLSVKANFQPITGAKLVVDTDKNLKECLKLCLEYVVGSGDTAFENI